MDTYIKIKNYPNYEINKKGQVRNIIKNNILKGAVGNSGYHSVRIKNDEGVFKTWGTHRLLAWVYIADFENIDGFVVNHLDGNKLNNNLNNLEITTYQGNAEHAGKLGLTKSCVPIVIKHAQTGEVKQFPSFTSAALFLNLSKDVIATRCVNGDEIVYPDMYRFKLDNGVDFKDLKIENIEDQIHYGRKQRIYKRCIRTNKITSFDSCRDLAKDLGVSESTVSVWVRLKTQPILKGLVQIQLAKDLTDWIEHDNPIKVYETFNLVKCVVITFKDGVEKLCLSAKEAADTLGIKPTALDYRLKQHPNKIFKDGTKCCYYSEWSPIKEI